MDWRGVDRGEAKSLVAAYRDYCLKTCKLKRSTTRQTYLCKFYEYALKEGWVKLVPFTYEERAVKRELRFLAHVDASGGKTMANDVIPRQHKILPKFLSMADIKSLLVAAETSHLRLALHTGLRREEIAAFPLTYVFDPDMAGRAERNLRTRLDPFDDSGMVTKGSKPRGYVGYKGFQWEFCKDSRKLSSIRFCLRPLRVATASLLLNKIRSGLKATISPFSTHGAA